MNWYQIVWAIANPLALLYFLYLGKRGTSLVTNLGPLFDELQKRHARVRTQTEAERLQSMYLAANKVGKAGLTYSLLGLVGLVGLLVMNVLLLAS